MVSWFAIVFARDLIYVPGRCEGHGQVKLEVDHEQSRGSRGHLLRLQMYRLRRS